MSLTNCEIYIRSSNARYAIFVFINVVIYDNILNIRGNEKRCCTHSHNIGLSKTRFFS